MEALVALVLFAIVATILYRTLVGGQRLLRAHVQDVAMNESTRAALSILPAEFRELSAGDGDILVMGPTSITFKSMQALYVLCAAPDTAVARVLLDSATVFRSRSVDVPDDSVLMFAERDPATHLDDAWLSASASSATAGTECPGGQPSLSLTLSGIPASQLADVQVGAPVRTFRVVQVLAYQDASGDWWLGRRQFQPSTGSWSIVQPVLGPLSGTGLALTYLDAAGTPTDSAGSVARIGVRVESRSPERVYRPAGGVYLVHDATTRVALRNNPRY